MGRFQSYCILTLACILLYAGRSIAVDVSSNQCGQPEVPENGHVVFEDSGALTIGASVTYKCDVGFMLVGPEKRICDSSGRWSEHAPVCAINAALYKPAIQSNTMRIDSVVHQANYSTDGNFDGICSSTKAVNEQDVNNSGDIIGNWWRVDLLETYRIYAVELLIPPSSYWPESNKTELNHIEIYAYVDEDSEDANGENTVCYKHKGLLETNRLHTFVCQKELRARYIKIVSRSVAPLQLCEVVVLSTSATSEWQCGSISNMDTWGVFEGKCFYGSTEPMPWFSANTHCQMNGANLLSDITQELHNFLSAQARQRSSKNAQHYWLGLVLGGGRQWTWINGKPAKSEFWASPQAREVQVTNAAYGAAMARVAGWNWVSAVQNLWYHWICQSKPRFCSSPGIPQNGGIMLSTQMYTIGASSYYYCNYGFTLHGAESRICLENGTWSGGVPKCAAVDCGKPDIPVGMTLKYINDSTVAGSKVEYQCSLGHSITGTSIRVCLPDGTWSDASPKCSAVDCGWPSEIANGRVVVSENATAVGSVAEWTCQTGFGLIGPPISRCAPNGQWVPAQIPYCYDITAARPSVPQPSVESWHHSSLMTGFVVAVVVLLLIVLIVLVWSWRRKKTYDGLSMSTLYAASSQLAAVAAASSAGAAGRTEVLYAFPPGSVTASGYQRVCTPAHKDEGPHYYVPSLLNASHDSTSLKSNSAATSRFQGETKLSSLSVDDLRLESPQTPSQQPQLAIVLSNGIPLPLARPIFIPQAAANRMSSENPIQLMPVHDARKLEKIINDIHLTLPARRRGQKQSPAANADSSHFAYRTVNQRARNLNSRSGTSIRDGAKTVGAAAGKMMTKVRRKISEANFNLFNTGQEESRDNTERETRARVEPTIGHYPTLRISLAEIVQQLNEANAERLKAAFNPVDQSIRSASPSASELFAFDDDDRESGAADGVIREDHVTLDSYRQKEIPESEGRKDSERIDCMEGRRRRKNDEESMIYDLPPDASALICGNLAKALLRQKNLTKENIYETPLDAEAQSVQIDNDSSAKRLEQVGVQIVHTYC